MVDTSRAEVSKVARVKGVIKKPWISIKAKLKNTRGVKQPVQVVPPSQERVEIDPPPQKAVSSVDLSASEDSHNPNNSVRTEPLRASLLSLPGLQKLNCDLRASQAPTETTLDNAPPTAPQDPAPKVIDHPETAPQRQGSDSDESVRSDKAALRDTHDGSDDTIKIAPNQLQDSPAEIPPVQVTSVQISPTHNTPIQIQRPPLNRAEKKVEIPRILIPGPALAFTPARPNGTPVQSPGVFSPPLAPSPQTGLLGLQHAQQKTPVTPANLFPAPSPWMVVPALGTPHSPIPTTPVTPNTPTMPATPIEHQSRIPGVTCPTPNVIPNQIPGFLPRSPGKSPLHNLFPVPADGGQKKDIGVIGDRRVVTNQPQPHDVWEPMDEPESEEGAQPVEVEPTPECNGADGARDRDGTKSQPIRGYSEPIYVGEQKYYVGRHLGGGAMGKVYSVVSKESMKLSALKVVKKKDLNLDDFSMIKGEWTVLKAIAEAKFFYTKRVEALRFVHHLSESWYDKDSIYFNMPLCVYSLQDHLRTVKFDPLTIRVYAAELVSGLEALHDMRIMHCDLKPENILVYPDGHLSISDFGLAISWLDPRYQDYPSHAFRGRRPAGTEGYMAPEIVSVSRNSNGTRRGNFGFAADIWSMGIVIAELGMGGSRFVSYEDEEERQCWKGDYRHFARTMVLSREMLMKRVEKNLRGDHAVLVERMIEINEASRPSFDEITAHPFFSNLDFGKVVYCDYPVPIPPFESVLPCRHTNADYFWFSGYNQVEEQGGPLPEDNEVQALCLTQDMDRFVFPEDFVWEIDNAAHRMRKAQQATCNAHAQAEVAKWG